MSQEPLQPPIEPPEGSAAPPQPGPPDWFYEPFETREVRKARQRAERATRRADRAQRRVEKAQERAGGQWSGARQLVDAAGDAATAALTAVSAAADEAQARLAAKARVRELEHALVTARAGGPVDVSPPTRDEALKLADRVDPGSPAASVVRGLGFIIAGIVAFAMIQTGGYGWLGFIVPLIIIIAAGSFADRIRTEDRHRKAGRIQIELAQAKVGATDPAAPRPETAVASASTTAASAAARPKLLEQGDPRTRGEILAVLDRLVVNVLGWVPDADIVALRRIRESAAHALPATDAPLDLTDHDTWLVRQVCIDYVPRAFDHYLALPSDMASEPLLDGRSAQQVLDEQLGMIETRLDEMAARSFRREAGGLLTHGRFLADSLRPDPFQRWLAGTATDEAAAPKQVAREPAQKAVHAGTATVTSDAINVRERERA